MSTEHQPELQWIVVRLGEDLNWWLEQTSEEMQPAQGRRGVLDPQQIARLVEALDEYRAHGLPKKQVADAFRVFALEAEISEGALRLAPTDETILSAGPDMFAVPRVDGEDESPYQLFLDAISAARIRRLNATHHYTQPCTEFEMYEELDAIDAGRYLGGEPLHAFDEISEILEWSPAEWDASDSES